MRFTKEKEMIKAYWSNKRKYKTKDLWWPVTIDGETRWLETAEWLVQHWGKLQSKGEKMSWNQIIQITELAKEREKQQILIAYDMGDRDVRYQPEQYYEKTYGGKDGE